MPRPSDKDRIRADQNRVNRASVAYKDWEDRWSCDMLEQYCYGEQWQGDDQQWDKRKYVINLFNASVNISKPSLLFQVPTYRVTPRLTRTDDKYSEVEARAKLQEDVLNTFVNDPKLGFSLETALSLFDSQFRFGWIEVGYSADYSDNPNAGKPMLNNDGSTMVDAKGEQVLEPIAKVNSEDLYIKWIPAKNCRTSERSANRLEHNDWIGYYEWQYIDDIRNNPRYKNTSNLQATGRIKGHKAEGETNNEDTPPPGMMKVWKVWDLRSKTRRIFAEGTDKYFLEEKFKFLPITDLKFEEILGQYLPLPPTYNWVHPQNQLNDIREQRRVHRKRANRRYGVRPSVDPEERAKLEEDEDMTFVNLNNPDTDILPIQDAPLDPAVFRDEATTLDDFTRVSGVSGESQQVAQSETATQANLIALMGQTRENAKRMQVGRFLGEIGRLILLTIKDRMSLPIWIKKTVDPYSPFAPVEAQEVAVLWRQIRGLDIGDLDNDIRVDLASMSPVQQAQERQDWITFLGLVSNPALGMVLSSDPELMRYTASLFNVTSERRLAGLSQALQVSAMMMMQQQAAKAGVNMPSTPGPGPTPTNSDTVGQLQAQLPVEAGQ